MSNRPHPRWLLLVIVAASILGTGLGLSALRWGATLTDDSFSYIASAKSLAAGDGLTIPGAAGQSSPLTHFPPLLPLALAGLEIFGIDSTVGIGYLNLLLFSATLSLTGACLFSITRSIPFSAYGVLLLAISEVMLLVHTSAMSEPLFIALTVAAILQLYLFLDGRDRRYLVGAAVSTGLAAMTRYVGVAMVLSGSIVLYLFESGNRRSIRNALLFIGIAAVPIGLMVAQQLLAAGKFGSREIGLNEISLGYLVSGVNVVLLWIAPGRFVHGNELALSGLGLVIGLAISGLLVARKDLISGHLANRRYKLEAVFLIFSLAYIGTLLIGRLFMDARIPLDARLLVPVHLAAIVLLVSALHLGWSRKTVIARAAVALIATALLGLYVFRAVRTVRILSDEGLGYSSRGWHSSDGIQYVRDHSQQKVYSNAPAAIYFHTGRVVFRIVEIDEMRAEMRSSCAFIVAFDSIPLSLYATDHEELSLDHEVISMSDATVYLASNCSS